jgi:hypothetical protein
MEKYEKIFNKLWNTTSHRIKYNELNDILTCYRDMPLRIFIKNYPNILQKRVKMTDDEGNPLKLGDYLKSILPNIKFHWDEVEEGQKKHSVISHGILLDYDFTIPFLSENLYALDGFVYISLHYE